LSGTDSSERLDFPSFSHKSGRRDLNPRPLEPHSRSIESQPANAKELVTPASPVCTSVCTSEAKEKQSANIASIAAALLALSAEERAGLVALLSEKQVQEGKRQRSEGAG
jgi:hypothetical protein